MSTQRDFPLLWKQVQHGLSYSPSMKVLSAVAVIILGGGIILALPENADSEPQTAAATTPMPETTGSVDESLCEKQAWPYIDQRCARRVEAARGSRQVRIVTDKGNSVTVMTPQPIVEAKPKPAPAPVVAPAPTEAQPQQEKIAAAPQKPAPAPQNSPAPKAVPAAAVQTAMAPANPPPVAEAMARENPAPSRNDATAPASASAAPVATGVDAFADTRQQKWKAARAAEKAQKAAEKAEKREAKQRKAIEETNGAPEDVVGTAKSLPAGGRDSRRARNGVPDEVIAAVERATASERGGRRSGQIVTIDSDRGGQRIYLVPREERW